MTRSIDIPWEMDENEYYYPWTAKVTRYFRLGDQQVNRRFRVLRVWPEPPLEKPVKALEIEWEDGGTDVYVETMVLTWIEESKNGQIN